MPSFFVREIVVEIDASTWQKTPVPPELKRAAGKHSFDVGEALHMLGTLTMPNILSPASPALFWAWLRYYLAPAPTGDLRITMDFADLDPHQKGILSDDFGVAISTKWLNDRYGGLKIVDGRRFLLQFPQHLRKKRTSKAKVGPGKCPDFVMRDATGRWHILECKGTQTLRHQAASLKTGFQQKHAIQLVGLVKGEQLVASLFIANEQGASPTNLKVIDPEEGIIRLTENQAEEMDEKADRVALARALGAIGLSELAIELSLPPDIDANSELLRPSKASRVRASRHVRSVELPSKLASGALFPSHMKVVIMPAARGNSSFRRQTAESRSARYVFGKESTHRWLRS
jgi:hypothetical protein